MKTSILIFILLALIPLKAQYTGGSSDGYCKITRMASNLNGDIPIFKITGSVLYNNPLNTPFTNTSVLFQSDSGQFLGSTLTDSTGYFELLTFNGNFKLKAITDKSPGGLNIQDVVLTRQKIAFITTFTPLQNLAADVNQTNTVNIQDAVIMRQKIAFLNPLNWLIPNYVFDDPSISVNGSDINITIMGLSAGDVNGSWTPSN